MEMFDNWMAVLSNPRKVLSAQSKKASVSEGAKNVAVASLISGIISWVIFSFIVKTPVTSGPLAGLASGASLAAIPFGIVAAVIGGLIGAGILHLVAKLLGGKGKYETLYYLFSIVSAPIMVVSSLTQVLSVATPVLTGLAGLAVALYAIYMEVLAIMQAHGFSTLRALATLLIPLVVVIVLVGLLAVSLLAVIGGAIFGALAR